MKYSGSLYSVKSKDATIQFYKDLLGIRVIQDFGTNFTFTGGLSFQTHETWKDFIGVEDSHIQYGAHNAEIYFETEELDDFVEKVKKYKDIKIIHDMKEHSWGQRGMRFYDPDLHIIEVSETLPICCQRFYSQGMSVQDISLKTGLSEKIVQRMLKR